jgi:peptidoglycan/LPS O-acetylase OafA/YrhL
VNQRGPSPLRQTLVGAVFLAAAAVIACGQWMMYDTTPVSQQNRARALIMAAVLAVAGVRMLLAPREDHELSVRASMLAATSLVFFALLAPHERSAALLVESLCGTGTLLAAIAALPPIQPPRR